MTPCIILPLGHGSRNNDLELRYCLRSIEKHLTGYGDIFIVGEKPGWLQNVVHIPCADHGDKTYDKERNIFTKIMTACADERVTDDFLFLNDDHYLLQDYRAGHFPYYYYGMLSEKRTVTDYKNTIWNTQKHHGEINPYYADIHCPILYNKVKFIEWVAALDWWVHFGFAIKTVYCNGILPLMVEYPDLKINEPLTAAQITEQLTGRAWFSIGDKAFHGEIKKVLQDLYPKKSNYER